MKKLIRDHIPGIPEQMVEEVCPVDAYELLKAKLDEEMQELKDSDYKDIYEYADVLEVLHALAKYNKKKWQDIEIARKIKFKEKGGFSNKILKVLKDEKN